ncbi:MAG: hypothetical protein EBS54_00435 [Betaproteobacteria bacterium]|nr:hypothetical protein [Betaproteobacteria bacterium]
MGRYVAKLPIADKPIAGVEHNASAYTRRRGRSAVGESDLDLCAKNRQTNQAKRSTARTQRLYALTALKVQVQPMPAMSRPEYPDKTPIVRPGEMVLDPEIQMQTNGLSDSLVAPAKSSSAWDKSGRWAAVLAIRLRS